MADIMYKMLKMFNSVMMIPLFAPAMFVSAGEVAGKGENPDSKKDEVPGDNYPSVVMSHHFGKDLK